MKNGNKKYPVKHVLEKTEVNKKYFYTTIGKKGCLFCVKITFLFSL